MIHIILEDKGREQEASYPTGKEMGAGPENSPGQIGCKSVPNNILHSFKNDTV